MYKCLFRNSSDCDVQIVQDALNPATLFLAPRTEYTMERDDPYWYFAQYKMVEWRRGFNMKLIIDKSRKAVHNLKYEFPDVLFVLPVGIGNEIQSFNVGGVGSPVKINLIRGINYRCTVHPLNRYALYKEVHTIIRPTEEVNPQGLTVSPQFQNQSYEDRQRMLDPVHFGTKLIGRREGEELERLEEQRKEAREDEKSHFIG